MGNFIQAWRKKRRLTQQKLADLLGVDKSTIWRYEKGITSPFNSTVHDIASALDVEPRDLVMTDTRAPLVGNVGAGETVFPLDEDGETILAPPGLQQPVALRVTGTSMMPAYRPGDLLFCEMQAVTNHHLTGRDCVVETEDGRRLVKKVLAGGQKGTVSLLSYETNDVEQDVRLRSAAVVQWVKRG